VYRDPPIERDKTDIPDYKLQALLLDRKSNFVRRGCSCNTRQKFLCNVCYFSAASFCGCSLIETSIGHMKLYIGIAGWSDVCKVALQVILLVTF
jgi:hypothetical protein